MKPLLLPLLWLLACFLVARGAAAELEHVPAESAKADIAAMRGIVLLDVYAEF